jgi:hypothetical protein
MYFELAVRQQASFKFQPDYGALRTLCCWLDMGSSIEYLYGLYVQATKYDKAIKPCRRNQPVAKLLVEHDCVRQRDMLNQGYQLTKTRI